MRLAMTGLAVLLAASTAHASDDLPSDDLIESLPVIAEIEGPTPVVLRGRLGKRAAKRATKVARAVYRDVGRRFRHTEDPGDREPVNVCLFARLRDYERFVELVLDDDDYSRNGFYLGARRLVVANLGASIGNLRHELVHALIGDDYSHIPGWLNEGMGSLYGTAQLKKTGYRFLVNYRLRSLHAAMKADRVPSFEELVSAGRDELYGNRSGTYYALSRYLLLYLEQRGDLDDFYEAMHKSDGKAESHLELIRERVDRDEFLAWAGKLRYRKKR